MQERVTMVETPDSVTYSNGGYFLPGSVRNAIEQTGPQKYYRNYALCQGMVNFNSPVTPLPMIFCKQI